MFFFFFISLLSLGVYRDIVDLFTALLRSYSDNSFIAFIFLIYRDIVDLFTALLRSYSDNSFIAFIFLILAVNTLYLYKTLFYSNNYLIRTNNRFKYLKYTLLTNLIISFIYYLISFLFVLLFALFKIKGGIDLNIIFNYSIPGYLYFFLKESLSVRLHSLVFHILPIPTPVLWQDESFLLCLHNKLLY